MSTYDDFAASLSRMRGDAGGTKEQCIATAGLVAALFHCELVEFGRSLRKEEFEALVYEDVSSVHLRFNGARFSLQRFSGQNEIKFEFYGFDSRVIPPGQCEQRQEFRAMSNEEAIAAVHRSMHALEALWRRELAIRLGSEDHG
jgi:hypothetical protein